MFVLIPLSLSLSPFKGIKFIVLADPRQSGIDTLLRKIYEIYSDYALKNPFYSLEMPIRYQRESPCFCVTVSIVCVLMLNTERLVSRCELFDQNLKSALEIAEKAGNFGVGSWGWREVATNGNLTDSLISCSCDSNAVGVFFRVSFSSWSQTAYKVNVNISTVNI